MSSIKLLKIERGNMRKILVFLMFTRILLVFSEPIRLNLSEAIKMAEENNKNIKESQIELKNAELEKKQAIKDGMPSLGYTGNYLEDNKELNKYNLVITQTLFDGFKTSTGIKNANKYMEYYEYSLQKIKNEVRMNTIKGYVEILKLIKQMEVYENSKKEIENNIIRTKRLYELNLVTKTDVLDLEYSLTDIETSLIETENDLLIEKIKFRNSLGLNNISDLHLNKIEDIVVDIFSISLDEDIMKAKTESIDSRQAMIKTEIKMAEEMIEKSEFYPSLDFKLSYGNYDYVEGKISNAFEEENMDWVMSFSLSGTLFEWGKNIDAYQIGKNETKIIRYEEETVIENLEINIKESYFELIRLEKLKQAKSKALESSFENFRYQKQRYENQLIDTIDFLEAENNLRKSEIGLSNAELDLYYEYQNYLNYLK